MYVRLFNTLLLSGFCRVTRSTSCTSHASICSQMRLALCSRQSLPLLPLHTAVVTFVMVPFVTGVSTVSDASVRMRHQVLRRNIKSPIRQYRPEQMSEAIRFSHLAARHLWWLHTECRQKNPTLSKTRWPHDGHTAASSIKRRMIHVGHKLRACMNKWLHEDGACNINRLRS